MTEGLHYVAPPDLFPLEKMMQTFYIEVTADIQAVATHPETLTDEERQFLEGSK